MALPASHSPIRRPRAAASKNKRLQKNKGSKKRLQNKKSFKKKASQKKASQKKKNVLGQKGFKKKGFKKKRLQKKKASKKGFKKNASKRKRLQKKKKNGESKGTGGPQRGCSSFPETPDPHVVRTGQSSPWPLACGLRAGRLGLLQQPVSGAELPRGYLFTAAQCFSTWTPSSPTTRVFPCSSLASTGTPHGPSEAWSLLASSWLLREPASHFSARGSLQFGTCVTWPALGVTPLWGPGAEHHGDNWPECYRYVVLPGSQRGSS